MLLCPHCQGEVTALPVLNSVSPIDFFLCVACAKVSERPKGANGLLLPLLVRPPELQRQHLRRAVVH